MSQSLLWPRYAKVLTVATVDCVVSLVATWVAFSLRLDGAYLPTQASLVVFALAALTQLAAFLQFRLYHALFRYTNLGTLLAMAKATAAHGLVLFATLAVLRLPEIPRSVGLIQPLLVIILVAATRAVAGAVLGNEALQDTLSPPRRSRLLIYGAGSAGVQTAAAIARSREFRLIGFVDDDPHKIGRTINGLRVFAPGEIPEVIFVQKITDILLAVPQATQARRNRIIESLRQLPVRTRTVPAMSDLASGRVSVQDFRDLDLDDLLGRDRVEPDQALLAQNVQGKVVLVTGSGGSIGSELCRQIASQRPRRLLLVEHSEFALYTIHAELSGLCAKQGLDVELVPLLASVRHCERISEIFRVYRPETVYHAAAYKHVPIVEHNVAEGVDNNVFGTLNVGLAAMRWGAARCVLISTDKAVRPTNVMGASKRIAEMILQALAASPGVDAGDVAQGFAGTMSNRTCFAMVRFGNVLDSSGSVVPLFRRQLAAGGPLTVTHSEVTRYFMTIPEAAQLVLQAGAMARGGEVFVLDMGSPVRILELAHRMVELSGRQIRDAEHPDGDIEVIITGLRPGEKLYEELLIGDHPQATTHPRIMKAREEFLPWAELSQCLLEIREAVRVNDIASVRGHLQSLVAGYSMAPRIVDHLSPSSAGALEETSA